MTVSGQDDSEILCSHTATLIALVRIVADSHSAEILQSTFLETFIRFMYSSAAPFTLSQSVILPPSLLYFLCFLWLPPRCQPL
jgi:hypothetical protein